MRSPANFAFSTLILVTISTSSFAQMNQPGFGFPYLDAERAAGQKLFRERCAVCHASQRQAFGPKLSGVVGRPAASASGFPYTDALRKSGLIWTEDSLNRWIADPAAMIPRTAMPHVSLGDPAERIYIIEYLKTLKGPGAVGHLNHPQDQGTNRRPMVGPSKTMLALPF